MENTQKLRKKIFFLQKDLTLTVSFLKIGQDDAVNSIDDGPCNVSLAPMSVSTVPLCPAKFPIEILNYRSSQ